MEGIFPPGLILLVCVGVCLCTEETPKYDTIFKPEFPNWKIRDMLGEVSGVSVDKFGFTFIFHRGDRHWEAETFNDKNVLTNQKQGPIEEPTIYIVNKDGNLIGGLGSSYFYMPHGITVDHEGNIWTTDVGLHQIMRFPRGDMKPDLVLGGKFVPGNDKKHFCKPTKVVTAKNGDFFVSDGYCNSRVVKFDKTGKFLAEFGKPNSDSKTLKDGEFNLVHGLALHENDDLLCVADRENGRVQCFNAGIKNGKDFGKFVLHFDAHGKLGKVYDVDFMPNGDLLILTNIKEHLSLVQVYNIQKNEIVDRFTFVPNGEEPYMGFDEGHAISAHPKGKFIVVGALRKACDGDIEECLRQQPMNAPYNVFRFDVVSQRKRQLPFM